MLSIQSYFRKNKTCLIYGFVCLFLFIVMQASAASAQVYHSQQFHRSNLASQTWPPKMAIPMIKLYWRICPKLTS